MKKLLFGLIVITMALAIMAPGTPGTPPVKKTPPPVKTTEPPPPVETQPVETQPVETQPVETQPVETEPVITNEPTEPPIVVTDVATPWKGPQFLPTKEGKEYKEAVLPKGGYGPAPQPEPLPTCGSLLIALVAAGWWFFGKYRW